MKEKSAAILTIKKASDMSLRGKKDIAEWLRNQAKNLLKHGKLYSDKFTARYLYK